MDMEQHWKPWHRVAVEKRYLWETRHAGGSAVPLHQDVDLGLRLKRPPYHHNLSVCAWRPRSLALDKLLRRVSAGRPKVLRL